jgi:hypothetical protein
LTGRFSKITKSGIHTSIFPATATAAKLQENSAAAKLLEFYLLQLN